jgi:hypothetical protein
MHDRDVTAIEPIAGKIEIRTEADFEAENVAVKASDP